MSKSVFTIDDTAYEVSASVVLEYVNNEICLHLEVIPDIIKEEEDWSLNTYFNTHVSDIKELNDKTFVWNNSKNPDGELAGYFNLMEEFVKEGTIKIINTSEQLMTIKWRGKFGMSDKNLSSFDTTFDAEIPLKKEYIIDACKSAKTKIGKNTELEILNLQEFNKELIALSKSKKSSKLSSLFKSNKYDFNAVLKLKLSIDNKDYFGEVVFTGDTRNHVLKFDANCPKKVDFVFISWDSKLTTEKFHFNIEQ